MNVQVHFLILGMSEGHIFKIAETYKPDIIYLISSPNLIENTEALKSSPKLKNIDLRVILIDPFKENTIIDIISKIISQWNLLNGKYIENVDYYIGYTGGTNLMAIAAGISSILINARGHYVIKDNDKILEFNLNKSLGEVFNRLGRLGGIFS